MNEDVQQPVVRVLGWELAKHSDSVSMAGEVMTRGITMTGAWGIDSYDDREN